MTWDYAPAPERAAVDIHSSYGLFIDGEFVESTDGSAYKTENPATEEVLADVAAAGVRDVDRAVEAAARAQETRLGPDARRRAGEVPLPDRPHHPGAFARARRPREPGQRQADPRVARRRRALGGGPFLLLRRMGRQARLRRFRARPAAARRRRPGHPLELPAHDGSLEARTRPGRGQHLCAQTGVDHSLVGAVAG